MALAYDTINALTLKGYIPEAVDNIFKSNVTFEELRKNEEPQDGGTVIVQPIINAKGTAESYSGFSTLDTSASEEFTAAQYEWRQYHRSISISRLEEIKNSGSSQVLSLVKGKIKNAERSIADKFGDDLYTDGGTTAVDGLVDVISSTSTYGGIAVADMATWAAVSTTITGSVALNDISKLIDDLTIGRERPTILLTTFATYRRVRTLAQAQQRYEGQQEAHVGFTGLMFEGIPLIADHKVPSGEVYALNLNYLHLRYASDENWRFEPFVKPTNQNAMTAHIYWAGNITCSQRRMQGKLTGITE